MRKFVERLGETGFPCGGDDSDERFLRDVFGIVEEDQEDEEPGLFQDDDGKRQGM